MKRAEILEAARVCVCGERERDYGTPENNFETIGLLWGVYLRAAHPELAKVMAVNHITAKDVAAMMGLLKVARIATGSSPDSFVDLAGYAACAGEINNNNCTNTNGSRPALMVRSDRVGPKPKAAPSITSKEVTSSLDTKANTLRRCTPPHTEAVGCCWSCPCGTYTAHKEREARRRDDRGPPACLQGCKDPC